MKATKKTALTLGRREWMALPLLGIKQIEARVDTGAMLSALHAEDIEEFTRRGEKWVRFYTRVSKKKFASMKLVEARLYGHKKIKSSNGMGSSRPVIQTDIIMGDYRWPILVTLVDRSPMSFRVLLGRQAMGDWSSVQVHLSREMGKPNLHTDNWLSEQLYQGDYKDK